MAEKALTAVVLEGYVQGISAPLGARSGPGHGINGIPRSQVSRLCAEIDDKVNALMSRPVTRRQLPATGHDPVQSLLLTSSGPRTYP